MLYKGPYTHRLSFYEGRSHTPMHFQLIRHVRVSHHSLIISASLRAKSTHIFHQLIPFSFVKIKQNKRTLYHSITRASILATTDARQPILYILIRKSFNSIASLLERLRVVVIPFLLTQLVNYQSASLSHYNNTSIRVKRLEYKFRSFIEKTSISQRSRVTIIESDCFVLLVYSVYLFTRSRGVR